jgi:hypothetical protein
MSSLMETRRSVEEAQHMYGVLSAVAYGSRRLRVEFKRKLLIKGTAVYAPYHPAPVRFCAS